MIQIIMRPKRSFVPELYSLRERCIILHPPIHGCIEKKEVEEEEEGKGRGDAISGQGDVTQRPLAFVRPKVTLQRREGEET